MLPRSIRIFPKIGLYQCYTLTLIIQIHLRRQELDTEVASVREQANAVSSKETDGILDLSPVVQFEVANIMLCGDKALDRFKVGRPNQASCLHHLHLTFNCLL